MSVRQIWDGRQPTRRIALSWLQSSHIQQALPEWLFTKNTYNITRIFLDFICKNKQFSAFFYFLSYLFIYLFILFYFIIFFSLF